VGLVLLFAGGVILIIVTFRAAAEQVPLQNAKGHLQMMGEKGSSSSTGMDFTLLRWACRVLSRRGGVFEVGGLVGGYVGREGWFGGEKGFGVVGIGSISTEQKASRSESYKIANERSKFGTSSGWEGL